jgi:hypothetical protein
VTVLAAGVAAGTACSMWSACCGGQPLERCGRSVGGLARVGVPAVPPLVRLRHMSAVGRRGGGWLVLGLGVVVVSGRAEDRPGW